MKKYLSVLLLIVFIVPSVAFASWWNPFSWKIFHKKEVVKIETPVIDINAEIKTKVDEQVKEALKIKADEDAKIAKQKIDEQKRIDTAVKNALDKQKVQTTTQVVAPAPQVVTPIPQNTTNSTEKNYFLETKSRVKELLDMQKSFEVWLQDSSEQFRTTSLTLAGYNVGGLYGQSRDASITLANASIEVNNKMIVNTGKWISYYENMLEVMNNNPNGFLDSSILNKLQTPESSEAEIEKIKADTNSSLNSVINSLKYH